MIDHITYQVAESEIMEPEAREELDLFLCLLRIRPVEAGEDPYEERLAAEGWKVAAYRDPITGLFLHFVAAEDRYPWALNHFCVVGVGERQFKRFLKSPLLEHYREGSGRLWLHGPCGIRVEVRP